MPKTIQIRDVDDDVYAALSRRAAETGRSVPEMLRAELTTLASRPSLSQWLEATRRPSSSDISATEIIAALDELRGPWPDAGR